MPSKVGDNSKVGLPNEVLQLDPEMEEKDIDVSHRLPKPRSAREEDPRPVDALLAFRTDPLANEILRDVIHRSVNS